MFRTPPSNWSEQGNTATPAQYAAGAINAPLWGDRCDVKNSPAQLIKAMLVGVVLIPAGVVVLLSRNPLLALCGLAIILCGPVAILKALRGLIGGSPAFSYDRDGITVPGWFGEKQLLWRDVSDFSIRTVTTYAYGIIKMRSRHSLYACKTGGGKMLLPTQFTGLDAKGLGELAARLELYRSGMADFGPRRPRDRVAVAPAPSPSVGQTVPAPAPAPPIASRPDTATTATFGRRQGVFGNR